MKVPLPKNERRRLKVLESYQILDSFSEEPFDEITRLAQQICQTPIATISLIDENRQWFKAKIGLEVSETSRDISFCTHAILQSDPLIIPDALADPRFADNPLVISEPHIQFYAGMPLIDSQGNALGTLCVVDYVPRQLTLEQINSLQYLSKQIVLALEQRRNQLIETENEKRQQIKQQKQRRFFRQIAIGFTGSSLIAIFLGTLFYWSARQVIETQKLVSHTLEVISVLRYIDADTQKAKSAVQTYLIVNQNKYLEAHYASLASANHRIGELKQLTADNPIQQERIADLTALISKRQTTLQKLIDLYHSRSFQEMGEYLAQIEGDEYLSKLNLLLNQMMQTENDLLQQRSTGSQRSIELAIFISSFGALAIIVIVMVIYGQIYREIVSRKQIEEKLEQQRDFTDTILNTVQALVVVTNLKGQIVRINQACTEAIGYLPTELEGKFFWELLVREEEREDIKTIYQAPHQSQFPYHCEHSWQSKTGELRLIAWSNTFLLDDLEQIEYIINTGIDITERHQAEIALEKQREWLEVTLGSIGDAVIATDKLANIMLVNPVAEKLTGWSAAEATGRNINDVFRIVNATTGETLTNPLEQTIREQITLQLLEDTALLDRDNRLIHIDDSCAPIRQANGETEGAVIIFRDITERKRLEEERDRFFSLSLDLFCIAGAKGYLERINRAWEMTLGWSEKEILSKPFIDFVHPQDRQKTISKYQELISSQQQLTAFENRYLCKDGSSLWLLWNAVSFNGKIYAAAHNITLQKERETEIKLALDREKELNELKSQFVSIVSHEFRTPLTTIVLSTDILEVSSHKLNEERKQVHFDRIKHSTQRMSDLLDNVLVIGQTESGKLQYKPEKLDFNLFCQNLVEEIQQGIGKDRNICLTEKGNASNVYMDTKLLNHIFSNLLSNAIKYSAPESIVKFCLDCNSERLQVQIQDRGIGIPEKDLPKLFQKFYRADNVGNIQGNGLGLSIVKNCVNLHGGSIEVDSQVNVGTTFTVILPLNQNPIDEVTPISRSELS